MTTGTGGPSIGAAPARGRRRWSRPLLVLALAVAGLLGASFYLRSRRPVPPEPPTVDLTGADHRVVRAVESALAAVRKEPRSAKAWGHLGSVLLAHDLRLESVDCFAEAERLDPGQPRWPYFQGVALAIRGEPEAALPKLRRAVDLWGDDEPAPRLRLAEVLLAQGHLDEAETHLRILAEQSPGDDQPWASRARLGLAQAAFARGDIAASRDLLARCESSPYARKTARILKAAIYRTQNDPAAADRLLAEATAWPEDTPTPDRFIREYGRLKTGLPALLTEAGLLLDQNRVRDALGLLQEAVEEYADSYAAWLLLGRAQLRVPDYTGAEQTFRRAVQCNPDVADVQFYLGVVLFEKGQTGAATVRFRKATELKPDYALAQFNLGQCLKLQKDPRGAIEAFRVAVRSKPHYAEAHREFGALLAEAGEQAEAREHLRLAVEMDPSDETAKKLLQRLGGRPPERQP